MTNIVVAIKKVETIAAWCKRNKYNYTFVHNVLSQARHYIPFTYVFKEGGKVTNVMRTLINEGYSDALTADGWNVNEIINIKKKVRVLKPSGAHRKLDIIALTSALNKTDERLACECFFAHNTDGGQIGLILMLDRNGITVSSAIILLRAFSAHFIFVKESDFVISVWKK